MSDKSKKNRHLRHGNPFQTVFSGNGLSGCCLHRLYFEYYKILQAIDARVASFTVDVCMYVRLLICTLLGISAAIFWQTLDRQRAM